MANIYTKTGDQGTTSLFNGDRVPKDHQRIEGLGTIDECNCAIGVVRSLLPTDNSFQQLDQELTAIQHTLFELGASAANPKSTDCACDERELEQWIDQHETTLPPLHAFILPSGSAPAAQLHMARTISRRAERLITPLVRTGVIIPTVQRYLNRLSDYLFVVSRVVNQKMGAKETIWQAKK